MNTIICASCKHRFNGTMKFCPFCGAQRLVEAPNTIPKCPRCKKELADFKYKREPIFRCDSCNGLWLDNTAFHKLTSERNVYQDETIPYEYRRSPFEQRNGYVPCARCDKLMVRQNFRSISGVIIDICGDHGAWFDAGELEQIRSFIANGGIDQAQDREITVNKDTIDSLKQRVGDLEMMEKILHKWKVKRFRFRKL